MQCVSSHLRLSVSSSLACALAIMIVVGCSLETEEKTEQETAAAAEDTDQLSPSEMAALERISTLGYVDVSPEPAITTQMGVTVFDEDRSYPGYNLYTVRAQRSAELVDARGKVVHRWQHKNDLAWVRSVLLENGDLLVVGDHPRDEASSKRTPPRFAMRLSWDNQVIWKRTLSAHHDIVITPDNRIGVLTVKGRRLPNKPPSAVGVEDHVTILSQDGDVEEERSLYQMLRARPDVYTFQPTGKWRRSWDPLHSNSLRWMTDENLAAKDPIYALGNILVCFRYQDSIAIFDWDRGEVVWTWGRGDISHPHDAVLLDNGNILLFDNGVRRQWSRVIELNPLTKEIVWEYKAPTPSDFFTGARGANQRLPNGNTLITESNEGRAFEVTPGGDIVWEFFVPHIGSQGHRQIIIRLYRYETELVEKLLNG
jgi:outer membrane protein assembly factor BamB